MSGPAIAMSAVTKSYTGVPVLAGLDLEVATGSMLALLGPNGAGKTTAVRILSTLLRPDSGTVLVNGHDAVAQGPLVRAAIGLTGQYSAVDKLLTGEENLRMMGRLYHLPPRRARARATELLEQFDLVTAKDRQVKTYSGGMRRRLDLAVSLIAAPPVIFLDEPTTGLDPRSRTTMWEAVRALLDGGTTILLTTQYLEEADQLADRVAVLDGGRVIAEGTAAELKAKVGADRLELGFADAESAARAAALMGGAADGPVTAVALDTVGDVRRALDALATAGLDATSIAIAKPTLDDVFLTLTGEHAPQKTGDQA